MTTPTDKEVIAWLCSPRPQDKAALEQFLDSVSPATANETLHRIASQTVPSHGARAHHVQVLLLPFFIAALMFCTVSDMHEGKSFLRSILPRIMPLSFLVMGVQSFFAHKNSQKGEDALLLLAERNDSRALPLLIAEWQRHPPEKRRMWNERVEAEATRLLDENQGGTTSVEWQTMRKVVTRLMQPRRYVAGRGGKDITPGQAYSAAAILRILTRAGGAENLVLLKSIADLPTNAKLFPNRVLVADVARVYQGEPLVVATPATAPMTATAPTVNPLQTLHRP